MVKTIPTLMICLGVCLFIGVSGLDAQIKPIKPHETTHALIVGISDYHKIDDLDYAHKDAEAFADFLTSESKWNVEPKNLVLLQNAEATKGAFTTQLNGIYENINENDRLILFFSGHGDVEAVTPSENQGYLLFHEVAPKAYSAGGALQVQILNQVLDNVIKIKKAQVIIFTDACRSGSLAGSKYGGPGATASAISELFQNTTRLLSCEADQYSVEGPWGGGRGLFSWFLIKGLKGEADANRNRYVEKYEIEDYLKQHVWKNSNQVQRPVARGLSRVRLHRVDPNNYSELPMESENQTLVTSPNNPSSSTDTIFISKFKRFNVAISNKHLLYPEEGSAYQLYLEMGDAPEAQAFKKIMKIKLGTALQNETQTALNVYIQSPGRELRKRWNDKKAYQFYPEYLGVAVELLGENNPLSTDLKSRENYFRGLNLRLEADGSGRPDSLYQKALNLQNKALELSPLGSHIYNELGLIQRRLQNPQEALSNFLTANTLAPTWGLPLANLGFTYKNMNLFSEAEVTYKQAISLDSSLALPHYNLAVLYEDPDNRQIDKAIIAYSKTLSIDSTFSDAHYNLASIYTEMPEQYNLAEAHLEKYTSLQAQDEYGYYLQGYLFKKSQEWGKAAKAYQQALALNPEDESSLLNLGNIYLELENYPEAQKAWEQYTTLKPNEVGPLWQLARCYGFNKKADLAIQTLEKAIQAGYNNWEELDKSKAFNDIRNKKAYKQLIDTYRN